MIKWYKVEVNLPEQEFILQVKINNKKLCLIRHQEQLYAIQNSCPHAGGIFSGGWCKNGNIVCPIHRWEYSLHNGRGAAGQGDYVNIYPVEEKEDGIYIGLKESLWKRIWG
ncbi:MAG: Rieske (2Fe-2S) protein [Pedobacter sp.]|nr:MAG: Rieske (2Fe-2S) protein [Pedobacter sp.]